ncbi:MAG: hypothetical protein KDD33_02575 [Bdellovibrionales bacterium]|nr:hypothetical protein [Bdellovibrionales bacterium]
MNKKRLAFIILIFPFLFAGQWAEHSKEIRMIEKQIFKYEQELENLVEKKKRYRDRGKIEETVQRIVEIHSELIGLRNNLHTIAQHVKAEHPDRAGQLNETFDEGHEKAAKKDIMLSPLDRQLNILIAKIRTKFAGFMKPEEDDDEELDENLVEAEKVIEEKKQKKREREAEIYLRRKSKVRLVK